MPFLKIVSPANPRIKEAARLRESRHRKRTGLTIVEGHREICRALEAGVKFRELYVCEGYKIPATCSKNLKESGAVFCETSKGVFAKMAYGERNEGLLAVCEAPKPSFAAIPRRDNPFFVVVEALEKPGNLGAVLRTCDGAGVDGVIVCGGTDIYNPNVIRASVGTVFSVPLAAGSNEETLQFLRSRHAKVYAASPQGLEIYTRADWRGSRAVVVGCEDKGLTDFWARRSDLLVKIPMRGAADSLNVSASAAVLIYEALRQREN